MYIVVPYQMFDTQQNILFYEDGECIKTDYVATSNLATALASYCSESEVSKINIIGNPIYLEKIKSQMYSKFTSSDVEVNIIER